MTKNKAIVIAVILALIVITLALFIFPLNGQDSFQIGNSNFDFYWIAGSIKLGLDLEGGMYVVYSVPEGSTDDAVTSTMRNLESLLVSRGYTEATVTRQGSDKIRVEIPSVTDTETLMNLIGEPATLEFRDSDGNVLIEGGKHLEDAIATLYNGSYAISLTFNAEGTAAFATATSENIGETIGIYINGEEIMSPTVNSAITNGQAVITGNYTQAQATEIATRLRAGTFAVTLTPEESSTISATLGEGALRASILAGVIGLALVIVFMIVMYRGLGVIASIALLIYSILMIYFLAIVPWVQLTLPSIAGIILSIGMAVDANVIIFERVRDERRLYGKPIPTCIQIGFKKALTAIIDSNVTTIIGSVVLIILGSATVQGFGITLLIGILLSMFTAIVITRLLCNIALQFNDHSDKFYGLKFKLDETVQETASEASEETGDTVPAAVGADAAAVKAGGKKKNKNATYTRVKYKKGGKK